MKGSQFLRSVLYEPWMILPEAADSYLPIIGQWLKGVDVKLEEKPRLQIGMAYAGKVDPGYPEDIESMPDGTIAIINLKGELTKYDGWCNYGAMSIANLIKALAVSKNISGCVVDIDGPGGAVNAIASLVEAIQFFQSTGKPIVGHSDLMASAHYYVGVFLDRIDADNTIYSRFGSIGTMIQFADYKEYYEKEGIKIHTVYAPESTHKNMEFEKAQEGDYEPMKNNVLSPLARKFQEDVKKRRGDKLDTKVEGILNGAMFFAEDAVKYGLIDGIGTLGDSIQRVMDMVEVRNFMRR